LLIIKIDTLLGARPLGMALFEFIERSLSYLGYDFEVLWTMDDSLWLKRCKSPSNHKADNWCCGFATLNIESSSRNVQLDIITIYYTALQIMRCQHEDNFQSICSSV
jgi:hypothetical protein